MQKSLNRVLWKDGSWATFIPYSVALKGCVFNKNMCVISNAINWSVYCNRKYPSAVAVLVLIQTYLLFVHLIYVSNCFVCSIMHSSMYSLACYCLCSVLCKPVSNWAVQCSAECFVLYRSVLRWLVFCVIICNFLSQKILMIFSVFSVSRYLYYLYSYFLNNFEFWPRRQCSFVKKRPDQPRSAQLLVSGQ